MDKTLREMLKNLKLNYKEIPANEIIKICKEKKISTM